MNLDLFCCRKEKLIKQFPLSLCIPILFPSNRLGLQWNGKQIQYAMFFLHSKVIPNKSHFLHLKDKLHQSLDLYLPLCS